MQLIVDSKFLKFLKMATEILSDLFKEKWKGKLNGCPGRKASCGEAGVNALEPLEELREHHGMNAASGLISHFEHEVMEDVRMH